jgi:hypothetical protein
LEIRGLLVQSYGEAKFSVSFSFDLSLTTNSEVWDLQSVNCREINSYWVVNQVGKPVGGPTTKI